MLPTAVLAVYTQLLVDLPYRHITPGKEGESREQCTLLALGSERLAE